MSKVELEMRQIYGPHYLGLAKAYMSIGETLDACNLRGYRFFFMLDVKPRQPGASFRQVNIRIFDRDGSQCEPVSSTGYMNENDALLNAITAVEILVEARKKMCAQDFIPGTNYRRFTALPPTGALLN